MKKNALNRIVTSVATSLLTLAVLLSVSSSVANASEEGLSKKTISVSGSYTVKTAPDIAYINIAVKTFDADAIKAQENNKKKMNNVIEQLKKLGIADKDIRTVDYRIQPRYEWNTIEIKNNQGGIETKREQILVGYEVTNSIKVTVNDLQKIGNVIDITVKEGINEANNISFGLSEATKNGKYLEALKGAVRDGQTKAEQIASVYGISLSAPIIISEAGSYIPSPINYLGLEKAESRASYDSAQPTPISGGEMEIRANVNMVFQY